MEERSWGSLIVLFILLFLFNKLIDLWKTRDERKAEVKRAQIKAEEAARKTERERAVQKQVQIKVQRDAEQQEKAASEQKSMAEHAEAMGQLAEYMQEGDHWRGKWDIRD